MAELIFTPEIIKVLSNSRLEHPIRVIRQRMNVLWLLSEGYSRAQAGHLAGVCLTSLKNYIQLYKKVGIICLEQLNYKGKKSQLSSWTKTIEEAFKKEPPKSVKQAASMIKGLTNIELSLSQVRRHMLNMGMKPLKTGSIPAKANLEAQQSFLDDKLSKLIELARSGKCHLFFMDASHYILSPYTAVLWCFCRVFIRAAAGRNRINVLGALNAITLTVETVINTDYINATTIEQMLRLLNQKYSALPIYIVLDNARYQHCQFITTLAQTLGIELVFLPPYSPNLNLIERLWKFIKKNAIYNQYFENAAAFHLAVRTACQKVNTDEKWKKDLQSLLQLNFQTFHKCNILPTAC